MPNGVCGRCGRHFTNALQLGAHVRTCRQEFRGAGDIIAVPEEAPPRITLHSLARRAPSPWGRATPTQQDDRRAIACSRYMRDYGPVLPPHESFFYLSVFPVILISFPFLLLSCFCPTFLYLSCFPLFSLLYLSFLYLSFLNQFFCRFAPF